MDNASLEITSLWPRVARGRGSARKPPGLERESKSYPNDADLPIVYPASLLCVSWEASTSHRQCGLLKPSGDLGAVPEAEHQQLARQQDKEDRNGVPDEEGIVDVGHFALPCWWRDLAGRRL